MATQSGMNRNALREVGKVKDFVSNSGIRQGTDRRGHLTHYIVQTKLYLKSENLESSQAFPLSSNVAWT